MKNLLPLPTLSLEEEEPSDVERLETYLATLRQLSDRGERVRDVGEFSAAVKLEVYLVETIQRWREGEKKKSDERLAALAEAALLWRRSLPDEPAVQGLAAELARAVDAYYAPVSGT